MKYTGPCYLLTASLTGVLPCPTLADTGHDGWEVGFGYHAEAQLAFVDQASEMHGAAFLEVGYHWDATLDRDYSLHVAAEFLLQYLEVDHKLFPILMPGIHGRAGFGKWLFVAAAVESSLHDNQFVIAAELIGGVETPLASWLVCRVGGGARLTTASLKIGVEHLLYSIRGPAASVGCTIVDIIEFSLVVSTGSIYVNKTESWWPVLGGGNISIVW